jgi:GTP-binding protein Era
MRDASASTGNGDRFVLDLVKQSEKPAILVLNKIDKIKEKKTLLPLIDLYRKEYEFAEIVPVSALKGDAVNDLLDQIVKHLPDGEPIFSEDELTDQPMRVLVAEMVRERSWKQLARNSPLPL